jgi:hypothetical protein
MARVGEALDIPVLRDLPEGVRREVDEFVDPSLHRQKVSWADIGVPAQVEQLTEQVWKEFTALAVAGGDSAENHAVLDRSREAYHAFYAEVEAMAQSTIHALRPKGGAAGGKGVVARRSAGGGVVASRGSGADALIRVAERVVPRKMLRRVPPVWRSRIMRAANKAARVVKR